MVHVGAPTHGNQEMRTLDRGFTALTVDSKSNLTPCVCLNPGRPGLEPHIDSVFAQNFVHLFGHIAILTRQELLPPLDDGDLPAITPKHFAKLNADLSPAPDHAT